jgi:hypothetical protein
MEDGVWLVMAVEHKAYSIKLTIIKVNNILNAYTFTITSL